MLNSPETEHQIPGEAADPSGEPTLREQVSSGVFWSGTARIAQQVIQFVISVVLARLLSPDDYGLMAMVLVFTGFAGMLAEFGFSSALVQKKVVTDAHVSSAFWITVLSGIALTALTIIAAPFLAGFYGKPELTTLFQVVALNFVVGTAGNVPAALLQKKMRFRTIGSTGTLALFISGVVGIAMAFAGFGVWSLVAQTLILSIVTTIARWYANGWFPIASFELSALREMWGFSANLFGFNFINYWARNADNLLIGKYFGAPTLGIYNRAYALMLLPITQVNSVVAQVVFPAFSSIQHDPERVGRVYLRAIGVIALVTFPLMMGLIVSAQPFVICVYGAKWASVAPLLQILGAVGMSQTLINSTGWIYLGQGRTDLLLRWGVLSALVTLASFVAGIISGSITTFVWCYAVANFLLFLPGLALAGRLINLQVVKFMHAISGPLAAALVMAACVFGVNQYLLGEQAAVICLLVDAIVGCAVYALMVFALRLNAWTEAVSLVRQRRAETPAPIGPSE